MNLKGMLEGELKVKVVEGRDKYAKTCTTGAVKFQRVKKNEEFKIEGGDLKQCKDKAVETRSGIDAVVSAKGQPWGGRLATVTFSKGLRR